jgi:hypothetical protein
MSKKLRKLRKNKKVTRKPLRSVTKMTPQQTSQSSNDTSNNCCNENELQGIPYDLTDDIQSIIKLLDEFGCFRYFTSFSGGSLSEKDVKLMEKRVALFFNWSFLQLKDNLNFQYIDANTFDTFISIIMKDHLDIIGHYVNFVKHDKNMMYSTIRIWIYDIKRVMEWYSVFANRHSELRTLFLTFQAVISNIGNSYYIFIYTYKYIS